MLVPTFGIASGAISAALCVLLLAALPAPQPVQFIVAIERPGGLSTYVLDIESRDVPAGRSPSNIDSAKVHFSIVDMDGRVFVGPEHFHANVRQPATNGGAVTTIPFTVEPTPPPQVSSGSRSFATTVSFSADTSPPPGMYRANVRFEPDAVRDSQDAPLVARYDTTSENLYFSFPPDRPAELVPGQRFLDVASDSSIETPPKDPSLTDRNGKPVSRGQMLLHPLTLLRVDHTLSPDAVVFRADGVGEVTLRSDGDATHLPGLGAIVDDPEVAALERRYAGKEAFVIGGARLGCVSGGTSRGQGFVGSGQTVTVDHVYRLNEVLTTFGTVGGNGGTSSADSASEYVTHSPLIVTLRVPQSAKFLGFAYSSTDPAARHVDIPNGCDRFSRRFSGAWDFERGFSLASLQQVELNWSLPMRRYVEAGAVKRGMTHEMIAWIFGYPSAYGTRNDVDRLSTWQYQQPPPSSFAVHFKRDQVVRYDPPALNR